MLTTVKLLFIVTLLTVRVNGDQTEILRRLSCLENKLGLVLEKLAYVQPHVKAGYIQNDPQEENNSGTNCPEIKYGGNNRLITDEYTTPSPEETMITTKMLYTGFKELKQAVNIPIETLKRQQIQISETQASLVQKTEDQNRSIHGYADSFNKQRDVLNALQHQVQALEAFQNNTENDIKQLKDNTSNLEIKFDNKLKDSTTNLETKFKDQLEDSATNLDNRLKDRVETLERNFNNTLKDSAKNMESKFEKELKDRDINIQSKCNEKIEDSATNLKTSLDPRLKDIDTRLNGITKTVNNMEQNITPLVCPPGWQQYFNNCYYLNQTLVTWKEAVNQCKADGAQLVEVDSMQEMDFVLQLALSSNVQWGSTGLTGFYIGGTNQTGGEYIWEASKRPVQLANWLPKQPDNRFNEQNCILTYVNLDERDGKWDDVPCSLFRVFVCEKLLPWGARE